MLWTALVRTAKRISKTSKSSCRTRIHNYICTRSGRLAQLVQSTCLTSRGSGVRIPHRPQLKRERKPSTKVGGFFHFRHRAKFTSARLAEIKKAQRCCAADGFLFSFKLGTRAPLKGSFAVRRKILLSSIDIIEKSSKFNSSLRLYLY